MKNTRIVAAKEFLKKTDCTHLLISDSIDIEYLTGFRSSNAALLISKKQSLLITDFRYQAAAIQFCKLNPQWKYEIVKERMYDTIASFIPEGSILGFQSDHLTVDNFNDLKKSLCKVKTKSAAKAISALYLKKTSEEIKKMQKAAGIGDKALEKLLPHIKPGVTETELARKLEIYCMELGSERPSFETILLFGKRAALPHGKPGETILKKGDWILIDFGCTYKGFCSDITRTFICGKASDKQRKIYDTVKEAQNMACISARAGIGSRYLDSIARSFIQEAGYGDAFGHALGHGVGIRIHERPRISPQTDEVLMEDSVVTIEPGIYIEGFGGVRIEDSVVLHKESASVLTKFPKELIEL